jgi:hypothetical protein
MPTTIVQAVPLAESERTKVFDEPFGNYYRVEAKDFNGMTQLFRTKAFTKKLEHNEETGEIDMLIKGKARGGWSREVGYPYNFIHNDVLFCYKRHQLNILSSFGLNFDLFAIDFALVVILNFNDGEGELHIASRDEWQQNGRLDESGEEVQLFLNVDKNRALPLPAAQVLLSDERVQKWMNQCRG